MHCHASQYPVDASLTKSTVNGDGFASTLARLFSPSIRNAPLSLVPFASMDLAAFVRHMLRHHPQTAKPIQDGNDCIDLVCQATEELGFPHHAQCLRKELEEHFHAQTANHHGIDSHPEFFQANVLYALGCTHCVPVFSGGIGYMDNDAYPRGVILSRLARDDQPDAFVRIALLPKKPNCLVNLRPPFEKADLPVYVGNDGHSIHFSPLFLKTLGQNHCTAAECAAIKGLIREFFWDAQVLAQPSLRDQLSCVNMKLWMQITAKTSLPPLVCLDTSWLFRALLLKDLEQSHSLLRYILAPDILLDLFHALQGVRGCWETDSEGRLLRGTVLFWGIDAKKRLVGLAPNTAYTHLVPSAPTTFSSIPLSAAAIHDAIQSGLLLPSLFCEFVMTAMARGLHCTGGIFQYNYLPRMAQGLCEVCLAHGDRSLADSLGVCSAFLAGLLPLRSAQTFEAANGLLCLEDGLHEDSVERLAHVTVQDALTVSLPYLVALTSGEKLVEPVPLSGNLPLI